MNKHFVVATSGSNNEAELMMDDATHNIVGCFIEKILRMKSGSCRS